MYSLKDDKLVRIPNAQADSVGGDRIFCVGCANMISILLNGFNSQYMISSGKGKNFLGQRKKTKMAESLGLRIRLVFLEHLRLRLAQKLPPLLWHC